MLLCRLKITIDLVAGIVTNRTKTRKMANPYRKTSTEEQNTGPQA
jgi:hypothetical protein